ncbi:MAG: MASE1 domain-containing protein, partial [Planctomycetota bacterium]
MFLLALPLLPRGTHLTVVADNDRSAFGFRFGRFGKGGRRRHSLRLFAGTTNHFGSTVAKSAVLIALYLFTAQASFELTYSDAFVPLWFPAGVALGFVATSNPRQWPWLLSATVIASLMFNSLMQQRSMTLIIGFALANVTRTWLGAYLLQAWGRRRWRIDTVGDVMRFAAIGCIVIPAWSAILGSTTIYLDKGRPLSATFPTWMTGNATGILVAAPPVMVTLHHWRRLRRLGWRFASFPAAVRWCGRISMVALIS